MLTLSLDETVAEAADRYALDQGVSVSEMVQTYLAAVVAPSQQPIGRNRSPPEVDSLSGIQQAVDVPGYKGYMAANCESSLQPRRPIWEVIAEEMKSVPGEDLASMPKDGASQIDHYVYGVPKRAV